MTQKLRSLRATGLCDANQHLCSADQRLWPAAHPFSTRTIAGPAQHSVPASRTGGRGHRQTVASIDSRLPALTKAILDFGTISSQLEREHWRQKDAATSLVARVEKREGIVSRIVEPAA